LGDERESADDERCQRKGLRETAACGATHCGFRRQVLSADAESRRSRIGVDNGLDVRRQSRTLGERERPEIARIARVRFLVHVVFPRTLRIRGTRRLRLELRALHRAMKQRARKGVAGRQRRRLRLRDDARVRRREIFALDARARRRRVQRTRDLLQRDTDRRCEQRRHRARRLGRRRSALGIHRNPRARRVRRARPTRRLQRARPGRVSNITKRRRRRERASTRFVRRRDRRRFRRAHRIHLAHHRSESSPSPTPWTRTRTSSPRRTPRRASPVFSRVVVVVVVVVVVARRLLAHSSTVIPVAVTPTRRRRVDEFFEYFSLEISISGSFTHTT